MTWLGMIIKQSGNDQGFRTWVAGDHCRYAHFLFERG